MTLGCWATAKGGKRSASPCQMVVGQQHYPREVEQADRGLKRRVGGYGDMACSCAETEVGHRWQWPAAVVAR